MAYSGRPPAPPPRDPSGIGNVVEQCRFTLDDNDMSSDSSSTDRRPRSNYDNVAAASCTNLALGKPPTSHHHHPMHHRRTTTPSPRPRIASPVAFDTDDEQPKRRAASACGLRAPRTMHRPQGLDCGVGTWGGHHRSPSPCCGPVAAAPSCHHWCGGLNSWAHFHGGSGDPSFEYEETQQRVHLLEMEKEQLTLQVNVLTDQVEMQNEKTLELEKALCLNIEQLKNSEILLTKEMTARSSVESNKLDLMTQLSALRLRLASIENDKKQIEERNKKLENELILTCACLAEKEADLASHKSKTTRNGSIFPVHDYNPELEKLKMALTSVIAANNEKEKELHELKYSLNRYRRLNELVLSNSSHKSGDGQVQKLIDDDSFSSILDSLSFGDLGIPNEPYNVISDKPPLAPRHIQQPSYTSTILSLREELQRSSSRLEELARQSPFSPIRGESPSPYSGYRYNSSENIQQPATPQKTPPSKRHFSTLPRPHHAEILKQYIKTPIETSPLSAGKASHSFHNLHHPNLEVSRPSRAKASSGLSFGKGFFKLRSGKRCSSAPELVPDESDSVSLSSRIADSNRRTSSPFPKVIPKEKPKGLKKIFLKVKRSGSESLNSSAAELKRGGVRATAGPRLGWSEDTNAKRSSFRVNEPFAEWSTDLICDWMISIGLSMYIPECKKWVKRGEQLLKATTGDFEKELNIKNPLHRKKLLLAITGSKEQTGEIVEPAGKIDHQWVVRWLDDIGLPQYKDMFYDARVDGRMLHHLTLEDLSHLKVINQLNHISIKTGIQVLRENGFDPHCLKRRSLPEDEDTPSDVSRWTNHRVMEWLRTVDLSEYAPNLRGSGVHGGIMLHEPRFNADLMATLLNIPPSKTLLRRHLTTQFKQLIGTEIMQKKREWEAQPNFSPLSPSAKVKAIKRSPFSLVKKKSRNEFEHDDYVCPMKVRDRVLGGSDMLSRENQADEEKFLMKEMVFKNEQILESMPASNV